MLRYNGHPDVTRTIEAQGGLITRRQALDTGMSGPHVDGLRATGRWVVVRRGVYMPAERWEALDEYVGQPRARGRAAHLTMRAAHVVSHETAARELGLAILTPKNEVIHVTRRGVGGGRLEHGVKHHLAPYQTDQVVLVDGIPVLDAARTVADICREHGYVHGLVACDAARQLGVSLTALWRATAPMRCWPEVTVVRAVIQDSDPGAESVAETLGRILLREVGLGPVETQFEIADGSHSARVDMRVGRHLVECDGRTKYMPVERGGLAVVDPDRVLWEEKRREDWLRGYRLGMSRLVWADFWGPRRALAKERILREYAATCAAYGTDISDLSHLVVRGSA
ncbi:type IV toxin-antitoxin system AbiEi family antitoxin domain-containing protein [Nocardioides agariphilus]|jgi:hypothetical protein|uniref:Type IV toxin-antitoxin system AbiEi family antitoxin domain-containing protein n=1 Tax=Nocardioides agariphilus TaxID=433664 RepID=A0A930VNP1_9ACTN|nr:type IV toxin-antitoxin system AbiEi family antitoxin domain-containing protein [Nocardioides agariphilus]MBF4768961.1 type IV toxin-antitoxin system AbiEi family antitoxin domain-containing protein [Nocardioides agariphilus]